MELRRVVSVIGGGSGEVVDCVLGWRLKDLSFMVLRDFMMNE
jgi:hypothetical protein